MTDDINDLLKERGGTHGHWPAQAGVSEAIWQLMKSTGKPYTASQAQALHMIATKLGRIITGDDSEPDHWRDIAGYATLAANELEPKLAPGFTMEGLRKAAEAQKRAVDGPFPPQPYRDADLNPYAPYSPPQPRAAATAQELAPGAIVQPWLKGEQGVLRSEGYVEPYNPTARR